MSPAPRSRSRAPTLARFVALLALAVATTTGCTSLDQEVQTARAVNDVALASPIDAPGTGAWIVVADGASASFATSAEAFVDRADSAQRYVFRNGERGDRTLRMAFLPAAGTIAGRGFADSLGLGLRRGARSGVVLSRDVRRVSAGADAAITMRISAPDGSRSADVRVVLDPDFDGSLLVSPELARALQLRRFEIPGKAGVHVALGRPFTARRARVRVSVPELDVSGLVETVHPASLR